MKNAVIYVHGKDGSANEANHYKQFFNEDYEVIGFDYKSKFPWQAKEEFQKYFGAKEWYKGTTDKQNILTKNEQKLVDIIKKYEKLYE